MDGYDGDSICEMEWDEAERQHVEHSENEESCYEGPSDLFDDDA